MMQETRNEKDAARTPANGPGGEALQHNRNQEAYTAKPQDVVPQSGFVFSAESEQLPRDAAPEIRPVQPRVPAARTPKADLQDYLMDLSQPSVSVDELLGKIHTMETEMPDAAPFGVLPDSKEKELPQLKRLREQSARAAAAKKRLDARLAQPGEKAPETLPEQPAAPAAPVTPPATPVQAKPVQPAAAPEAVQPPAPENAAGENTEAEAQWKQTFLSNMQRWYDTHQEEQQAAQAAPAAPEADGTAEKPYRDWLSQMRDRFNQLSEEIDEKLDDADLEQEPPQEQAKPEQAQPVEEPMTAAEPDTAPEESTAEDAPAYEDEAEDDAGEEEAPRENGFALQMRRLRDKFSQMAAAIEEKLSAEKTAPVQEAEADADPDAEEEDDLPPENRFASGLREFWSKYVTLEAADEELTAEQEADDTWQQTPETELDDGDAYSEEDEIELGRPGSWLGGLLAKVHHKDAEQAPAEQDTLETALDDSNADGEEDEIELGKVGGWLGGLLTKLHRKKPVKEPEELTEAPTEQAETAEPAAEEAAEEQTAGEPTAAPAEETETEPEEVAAAEAAQPEKKLVTWLHLVNDWFDAPQQEQAEEDALPMEEYLNPEDAPRVQQELEKKCTLLTLRAVLAALLTVTLILLGLSGQQGRSLITGVDPVAAPATWVCANLLLLGVCALLDIKGLAQGLKSLLPGRAATADGLSALAVTGAALQLLFALLLQSSFEPMNQTVFAGVAAALVFTGLLGKRMAAAADRDGFAAMTSGVEHATAYCLEDDALSETLCSGMGENQPRVLLSRPDALMRGFVAQSSAPHYCDRRAMQLTRLLCVAALVAAVLGLVSSGNVVTAATALAGVLCMGVPAGMLLLRGITTMRMQRSAGSLGAVVPGWPAIEKLGRVNVVQVDASDLLPPACAYLVGIKTLRKERIDTAILYATSILVAGCNTLAGLFCEMIENHTDMLYPMNELERRPGLGYVAFCDDCRVLLGTRAMMEQEQIKLPPLEYEQKYSNNGSNHVLYLAVSGRLSAMFVFGYKGTKKVAHTLKLLRSANIRLMVTAQDPTLTAARIEKIYRMQSGFIKVLSGDEQSQLLPAVGHRASQEGCMAHLGSFVSLVGGLRAASGAERAQRSAGMVQVVSAIVSAVLGLLLSLTGGMTSIALTTVLLYQLAWMGLSLLVAAGKKY